MKGADGWLSHDLRGEGVSLLFNFLKYIIRLIIKVTPYGNYNKHYYMEILKMFLAFAFSLFYLQCGNMWKQKVVNALQHVLDTIFIS